MAPPAQSTPSYPSSTSSPDALTAARLLRLAPSPTFDDAMARVRHYIEHDIGEAPPAPAELPPPPPPRGPRLRLRMDSQADYDAVYNRSASGPQAFVLDVPFLERDPEWLPSLEEARGRRANIEILYDGDEPWESSDARSVGRTPQVNEGKSDSDDEVETDSEMENLMARISHQPAPDAVTTTGRDGRVYSVATLIGLQKQLPVLKCNLKSFSADAWRAQILVPPGQKHDSSQTWFPADFPPSTARTLSEIPDHELPSSVVRDCLSESTEDEVVFRGAGNSLKKKQRDNSSSLSTNSMATSAALPHPHRQPYPPPKGVIPQQDAGFARFLKEATSSSPNNKRVTAGGRIVSAENPPRLYGRRKQGTDNSWARVPYSHIQTEMPQGSNDTFLSFPNGSFYWGPQGELYVRPAPEVLYQALYPAMQTPQVSLPVTDPSGGYQMPGDGGVQVPGQGVPMGLNVGPQVPMMGQGLPVMQMPMHSGPMAGVNSMMATPGAAAYGSQFQWTHNGDGTGQMEDTSSSATRNIRTPRVHFPIGSRFDYEQNQQTLRNRLAQLLYEMDNLHYLSAEEAELKKLEKKMVEDQIEQFRQVWELQTYLAGDAQDEQEGQRQEMPATEAQGVIVGSGGMSSVSHRGSHKKHEREASTAASAKAVPNDGVPMVVSSRGSEFQPAPQDMSNVISGAQAMTTPRKPTKDFVVQTPASVAPVHGKENIGKPRPIKSNTLSAFPPGLDQLPARQTVVGGSLRGKTVRKDMTPSIESLHIQVDLETTSAGVAGPSVKSGVLEDKNLNKDNVQDESTGAWQSGIVPKVSVESLRKSSGMPTGDIEASKIPADKHAFADQFRIIKSASKIFYRYASVEHVEEAEADKDDPMHPYHAVARGESSSAQGKVKTATRDGDGAWDVTALAPKSDNSFTYASSNNENSSKLSNKERSLRPSSAIESLRRIYQQHSQRFQSGGNKNESRLRSNQAPSPTMEDFKTETSSKGKKVELAQEREAAEQNVKIQEVLGVINDPIHQKDFLEQMLKVRRQDGVGYQREKFEKLVHEELGKHNTRKHEIGQSNKAAKKVLPGNTALGMSKLNVKAPLSPPLSTATTARGLLGAYRPPNLMASGVSAVPSNMPDVQSAASRFALTGALSSPLVHTSSRTSANDPHCNEVLSHFRHLSRDEQAEIARYRAEHPDER